MGNMNAPAVARLPAIHGTSCRALGAQATWHTVDISSASRITEIRLRAQKGATRMKPTVRPRRMVSSGGEGRAQRVLYPNRDETSFSMASLLRELHDSSDHASSGLFSHLPIARWAPLPLRLIVGYGFMEHGFAKMARGVDNFIAILAALGVPAPHLMAAATIAIEIGGGAAVLLGAFMPLVSLPMAVVLLVAMFTVHLPYGFSSIKLIAVTPAGAQFGPPGFETDLLYLACLAALVLRGAGPFSIDGLIMGRLRRARRRRG
jgi:putative oxidoreductase